MTERVRAGGLQVARVLHDFVNDEALPGTGVAPEAFWTGLDRIVDELAPENRALLAKRDRLQAEIDAWHRERRGKHFDLAEYKAFLHEDRLPAAGRAGFSDRDRERRSGDRRDRRAAARRAGHERALRAERRQRPLGQPLRRALRHRRDPRGGRRGARQGLQSGARPEGRSPSRAALLDEAAPLDGASWRDATGFRVDERRARRHARRAAATTGLQRPGAASPAIAGSADAPTADPAAATTACISRSSSTATIRSAATIRPASPTSWWNRR